MSVVDVQIVYGSRHRTNVFEYLLPSLKSATANEVRIWLLNFEKSGDGSQSVTDLDVRHVDALPGETRGFGANHNRLYEFRGSKGDFVILNPDCVLTPRSIDRLLDRRIGRPNAAIIEGRQWPFEHPKEYDQRTLATPWASGAFALISGDFFSTSGGFDERYHMYLEDVDLSWRAWLGGYEVLYEPLAVAMHFSGGPYHRPDLQSTEESYGSVNFLALQYKFFGQDGLHKAIDLVRQSHTPESARMIECVFEQRFADLEVLPGGPPHHPQVKVLGFNQFHEMRR